MKLFLLTPAGRVRATEPFAGADHYVVDGACPACGASPYKVQGRGLHATADDRAWEADGFAVCCGAGAGTMRAEPDTLFGVSEDYAMTHGRWRVY